MPRRLSSMHARTICHATEDGEKVELALRSVVGDSEVRSSRSEGHHGNPIVVLESDVVDERAIIEVLGRLRREDLAQVASSLSSRMDDSSHLHLRLDKQEAYAGRLTLAGGEDAVALRIKVRAFPAKVEVAEGIMRDVLEEVESATVVQG